MSTKVINIANDFSLFPTGRYARDSSCSAEALRDRIIIPALKEHSEVIIELDGTYGYSSSFLEEAFGGLLRAGYTSDYLNSSIKLSSKDDSSLILEINEYINNAEKYN